MKSIVAALMASSLLVAPASAEAPSVVASIKPVHALVAAVMDGVGTPHLVVNGAASPHTFSLRPSDAEALQNAELIFWIGPEMETFLSGAIQTLGADAKVVSLMDAHNLITLDVREGGAFETHEHDDHDQTVAHTDHMDDDHDEDHDDAHANEDHAHEDADEHDHEDEEHGHEEIDLHLWLDPLNAKAMVHEIAETLVAADPDNAAAYAANAEQTEADLDALIVEVEGTIAPVAGKPFIAFHDAYQYFENRFGVTAAGTITVSPETMPGAQRLTDIRAKISEVGAVCVFSEPQFTPRLIDVVTEGSDARSGVLDPLGADLTDGPDLYFQLIRNMASSFKDCLDGN